METEKALKEFKSSFFSETSDVKASIAALNYVLNSAAKYSVNSDTLANELQQLGLPKGM